MSEAAEEDLQLERPQQLGALDLGSNSFHLIIAQAAQGRIQVLDKHKEMVRLAAGLDQDNQLSEEAQNRALECLSRFAQRLRPLLPENVRVVGTNTLRQAESKSFLKKASAILGHRIDIISGYEEARLIYLGVCHDLGASEDRRLIIDIGGGSTEIVIGQRFQPDELESLFMGCVSMTQQQFKNGKISAAAMKRAIDHAQVELEPVAQSFLQHGWQTVVGTSGTINAVQEVLSREFGANDITPDHLFELSKRLIKFGRITDIQLDGLNDDRKPVFVGGVAILTAIFQALKIESMQVSGSALREGLIFDLIGRQHQDDARDQTVQHLMQRFHVDTAQAREVRDTALSLWSQVAMTWELVDSSWKHLISWSANLLEVGMDIAHSGYHKHGAYLLENMDMPGFARREQQQLALLIRSHRRKLIPSAFSEHDPQMVRLSCLIRIAALLHRNRSHEALPHVNAAAEPNHLELMLPKKWLKQHPLTQLDLNQEADYLAAVDINLSIKSI